MNNQEAIRRIKDHMRIHFKLEYPRAIKITEALNLAISALETQQDDRWIPATDRLPDEAGNYICTVKFIDNSIGVYPVWWHNGIRTDISWELDGYEVNVIAWKQLPEPYLQEG